MADTRKRQVWLRPDQADLVVTCLEHVKEKLNEGYVSSDAHRMAGRYTYRRINEVVELFKPPTSDETTTGKDG